MNLNPKIELEDISASLLIIAFTFGYYLDNYIPDGLKKISWLNFEIKSYYFDDVAVMIYIVKMKIYIIIMCVFWYFTSKLWWKSAILVIITIELLKLISTFSPNRQYMDEIEFLNSLPVTIPIIVLLFFVSKKIKSYRLAKLTRDKIDREIDDIFYELQIMESNSIYEIEKNYKLAKKHKHILSRKEYINRLLAIRNSFYDAKS